jgi:membrane-bound lytic murein transglycosylase A
MAESGFPGAQLKRLTFGDLDSFAKDDLQEAWPAFLLSCEAMLSEKPHQRLGISYSESQKDIAKKALKIGLNLTSEDVRFFLEENFTPFLIVPEETKNEAHPAFFTAYYRPEVAASPVATSDFSEPLFARPVDLVTLQPGEDVPGLSRLAAAQRQDDGTLTPYPTRGEIDSGKLGALAVPLVYVADSIEAFMIHVQGSARLRFPDGSCADLTYAGRNGRPYTSIGKILIADGALSLENMSLARLKAWVRANGQKLGEKGRALLHRNESFVFFSSSPVEDPTIEPVAAANVRLTAHRSIAIDRSLWPYGLPFWIEAELPWHDGQMNHLRRLMIAQDTGSAILGPARADLYFGTGDEAGVSAGNIRHSGRMIVLLPHGFAP